MRIDYGTNMTPITDNPCLIRNALIFIIIIIIISVISCYYYFSFYYILGEEMRVQKDKILLRQGTDGVNRSYNKHFIGLYCMYISVKRQATN